MNSPQGSATRPTSDKVRAAVFSSLMDSVHGARFLDLFAGTGSVGIEAYSRGAAFVTFVDKHSKVLQTNAKLMPAGSYKIITSDIFTARLVDSYDIIYADPPYGVYGADKIMDAVIPLMAEDAVFVLEESVRTEIDTAAMPLALTKERRYGDTLITYWALH